MLQLNEFEISCIGTQVNNLHQKTRLRRLIRSEDTFFDCYNYDFIVENGYKRYVPWSGPIIKGKVLNDKISKDNESTGFYPTYAANTVKFYFKDIWKAKSHTDAMIAQLGSHLKIDWNQEILTISVINPEHLLELDFMSNSFGCTIAILARSN